MPDRGLSATELAAVLDELRPLLRSARVRDVARLVGCDDLLLFLEHTERPLALHLVPGGRRARVTCTQRRYRKEEFETGPRVDRLRALLTGAVLTDCSMVPAERACRVDLRDASGSAWSLRIELFGARGLWCLVDDADRIHELSRLPNSAGRDLSPGARYTPPPPGAGPVDEPAPRFSPPVLAAVDAWFTLRDRDSEFRALRDRLQRILTRAVDKTRRKIEGLARQRDASSRAPALRQQADMLLAYGFALPAGAAMLSVADPADPSRTLQYPLEPGKPIQAQAEKLYRRARKLEDGVAVNRSRHAAAVTELETTQAFAARLAGLSDFDELQQLAAELAGLGLLPDNRPLAAARPTSRARRLEKITAGHNFRRFVCSEGYLVLVGRNNQQNDRLSIAVARGNDLWFHVGRGHAGSHVVLRLPRGKTASLESMLDAACLAVHFSKARGAARCEVIYTQAKNVRKPKGLPPGRVTTSRVKSLTVDQDTKRLQRMLDTADQDSS